MFESKKIKLAMACSALVSVMALTGCDNNTTTNSSPIIENPTTSVSGRVTDTVTGEPIKNAVVMIEGLNISARTDADGNYTLRSVPPNNTGSGGALGAYRITIDMKGVTSPVAMSDTTITNRYADMDVTGNAMPVQASDVNVIGGTSVGETGINNVVNFNVGKASGTISGTVFGMDGSTFAAGARVELWQGGENVAVATSDATDGTFSFGGVEAGNAYNLIVIKDDMQDLATAVPTMLENQAYSVDVDQRIVLGYADTTSPGITDAPDANMDKANDADASFSWVLNESIDADPLGYRDSFAVGGQLHNDIVVTYTGAKVGGVAKTVAWNADFTILTVTVPAASLRATSGYTINMAGITEANLMDTAGNPISLAAGGLAAAFANVSFTTNGGTDLSATAPVVTVAAPRGTMNHNEASVDLDWPAVAGASSYNVYRTATVGGVAMGTVLIGNVTTSSATDNINNTGDDFGSAAGFLISAEREAVSYTYQVAGVNSNKVEGMMSTATSAIADTQKPRVTLAICAGGASAFEDANGNPGDTLTVTYSEPMNIALAETLAAYGGIVTGVVALDYNTANDKVTLSYDAAGVCVAGGTMTVAVTTTDVATNGLDTVAGDGNGNTFVIQ